MTPEKAISSPVHDGFSNAALQWVVGRHAFKFGGEQRVFLNNFWQPNYPTGCFYFPQNITAAFPGDNDITHGNSFATMLMGWADTSSGCPFASSMLNIVPLLC